MTDTVNKKSMIDEMLRIKSSQEAIKEDLEGSDHHMYWRAVGKLELIEYLLTDCTPSTPVQGYQEEIPSWEEIAGIQEARALHAEAEVSSLRQALSQTDIQPEAVRKIGERMNDLRWKHIEASGGRNDTSSSYGDELRGMMRTLDMLGMLGFDFDGSIPAINSTEDDQPGPSISSMRLMLSSTEEEETE